MRRPTNFPQRALYFETLEQKRPLAVNVLSCGEADPEAVVAEEGGASQRVADMATELNSGLAGDNHVAETETADKESDLVNEKSSTGQSDLDASADGQVDIESDDPEQGTSDDDDDSMMDDESHDDDDLSDDDDKSDDDDEDDSEEEDDDSNEDDLEDDEDESDDDDDDSEDDEESDEVDDSDEEDDDSDEDDLEEDEDESDGDEDDDDEEDESDDDDGSDIGSEATAEELSAATDGDDERNAAIHPDTSRSASSLFALQRTVENRSQIVQAVPSTSRRLESHDDLRELLQLQSGNTRRDIHEMSRDAFVEQTSDEIVNPAGGLMKDGVDDMLQSRLQPAFVDAVFTSLG